MTLSIFKRKVKCYRCRLEIPASSAHLVNGKFFSHGCYEKIKKIQQLKSYRVSHNESELKTCSVCGSRYVSDSNLEKICGILSPKCCFCCEFATSFKYKSQKCPFETYIERKK